MPAVLLFILLLIVKSLIASGILFASCRIAGHPISFAGALITAVATSLAGSIPYVGWLAALILFLVLINKLTDADIWSAIWIGVVNLVLAVLIALGLALLIGTLSAQAAA